MTKLGLFLAKKSINKAEVARKTGISTSRLSELTLQNSSRLRAEELYLIILAIDLSPGEVFETLYENLKLVKN
ncbi:MAG: helix-turn-helix domain-containing protein [Bacteroidia bacterium]